MSPTITEYGCVLCQRYHREGLDAEYQPHLMHQSKHGTRTRAPIGAAETFVAHLLADEPLASAGAGEWKAV